MKQDTPQDLSFFENFKYQVVRKVVHAFNLHVQGEISQTKLNSREVETLPKSDVHQLGEQWSVYLVSNAKVLETMKLLKTVYI